MVVISMMLQMFISGVQLVNGLLVCVQLLLIQGKLVQIVLCSYFVMVYVVLNISVDVVLDYCLCCVIYCYVYIVSVGCSVRQLVNRSIVSVVIYVGMLLQMCMLIQSYYMFDRNQLSLKVQLIDVVLCKCGVCCISVVSFVSERICSYYQWFGVNDSVCMMLSSVVIGIVKCSCVSGIVWVFC